MLDSFRRLLPLVAAIAAAAWVPSAAAQSSPPAPGKAASSASSMPASSAAPAASAASAASSDTNEATAPEPTTIPAFKASAPLNLELFNAQWFDGTSFKRGSLFVENGYFVSQRPKHLNRRMDLKGEFLIAPLGEAHNNNLQSEWGVGNFAQRYMQDGVFYAAMLCGDPANVNPVRGKLNQPDTPDTLFVTACITASDGYPLAMLLASPVAAGQPAPKVADFADKQLLLMDSPTEVDLKWPLVAARRTDLVKLVFSYHDRPEYHGRPAQMGRLGVTPATAAAIVRHAHHDGLKVVAHVETATDFEAAIRAGVDQIGHLPGYFDHNDDGPERFQIAPAVAAMAAKQKVEVVTGTAASNLFAMDAAQREQIRQTQAGNLRLLKSAGVPLLLGSDVFTGTSLTELQNLAGLNVWSNAELLRMASVDTPKALFPKRRIGCFEAGCEASFLVLAGNPLQDLAMLDHPLLRVKQGRLLSQMEDVARASSLTQAAVAKPGRAGRAAKGMAARHAAHARSAATAATGKSKPKSKTKAAAKSSRPAPARSQ